MIYFNLPTSTGEELSNLKAVINSNKICGDGAFTKACTNWLENNLKLGKVLLTTSCTHALEMCALLANIKPNDEVIMPSFTFSSTANAFVLRGAKIIFVDIRPDTLNIDEKLIEAAITPRTKAIVPVHYAGVAAQMDYILELARHYNLLVIEDAAQGIMSTYKGQPLGSIGDFGCYSFHETSNFTMGEGGALLINPLHSKEQYKLTFEMAELILEKGTAPRCTLRSPMNKYNWLCCGSSYVPSELNAAYLHAQLIHSDTINSKRIKLWELYHSQLSDLEKRGCLIRPTIPETCTHNAYMYYIKLKDLHERNQFIQYLNAHEINPAPHFVPLHHSPAGEKYGTFSGNDIYTTKESERLVRLPLYYNLSEKDVLYIIHTIYDFFKK